MGALFFLLAQRRFWAAVMGLISAVTGGAALSAYGVSLNPETLVATIDIPKVFAALAPLSGGLAGILAGWSLFKPKALRK
jgi:hypothetical protein